jgi:large subunit ribosomal protein L14e
MKSYPVEIGRVVISKCGRDAGRRFLVTAEIDEDFVFVADGKNRTLQRQKKKRKKHLKATETIIEHLREKLRDGQSPENHELAACLLKEEG